MSELVITGTAIERSAVVLMARILGAGGIPITQASVSTITYEVGYTATPPDQLAPGVDALPLTPVRTSAAAIPLIVADVIYDILQIGPTWQVVAASPAAASTTATSVYVDPLKAPLSAGTALSFVAGIVTLTAAANTGARLVTGTVTGTLAVGDKATANVPHHPAESPWKIDSIGYNFRYVLPAASLPVIPLDSTYPAVRWNVVSVELTPTVGEVFGWEYQLKTLQRLHGKWQV